MHARSSSRPFLRSVLAFSLLIAPVMTPTAARVAAQAPATQPPSPPAATNGGRKAPTHAQPVKRLLITNAMVIYGNGKPAYGPMDILAAGRGDRADLAVRTCGSKRMR